MSQTFECGLPPKILTHWPRLDKLASFKKNPIERSAVATATTAAAAAADDDDDDESQ